jgi:NAD(P)H dehydrogenase (quinone)
MSTEKIPITGATGDTGGYAIEQLLQKGHQVRALVHRIDDRSQRLEDKGVEVVAGDYLDLDAMRAALQGVRRAYFVYPIRPAIIQATAYFAQAARDAGLEAVVNMSQISARAGVFAGTNDVIETIGGRPPMSLEAFIEKHRKAFE